jgi:hypothetical protein
MKGMERSVHVGNPARLMRQAVPVTPNTLPVTLTVSVAIIVLLALSGCSRAPRRPEGIPSSSIFVPAAKGGYWQTCRLDQTVGECRCTIYLGDGRVVYDEVFLPYNGGAQIEEKDLEITPEGTGDTVKLANGRLLLPQSDFEKRKRYWDWRFGKAATY